MIESKWFEKKLKKTVNVPKFITSNMSLRDKDTLGILIKDSNKLTMFPSFVSSFYTNKGKTEAYRFCVPSNIQNHKKLVKIKLIKLNTYKHNLYKNSNFLVTEWINSDEIVIWDIRYYNKKGKGVHGFKPLIISKNLKIDYELNKYLGLYFADGSKTKHYRVFASTPQIAKLIIRNYKRIIKNINLTLRVQFTKLNNDNRNNSEIEKSLITYWKNKLQMPVKNVYVKNSRAKLIERNEKYSKFGTLIIDDTRSMAFRIHEFLIDYILNTKNRNMILKFFEGAALGDACVDVSIKTRAFKCLEIATNNKDLNLWKNLLEILNFNYGIYFRSKNEIKLEVRGFYTIFCLFKDGLFLEYPKRRQKLLEALQKRTEFPFKK